MRGKLPERGKYYNLRAVVSTRLYIYDGCPVCGSNGLQKLTVYSADDNTSEFIYIRLHSRACKQTTDAANEITRDLLHRTKILID